MQKMIIDVINAAFTLYYLLILAKVFLPWFPKLKSSFLGQLVSASTDPLLKVIRKGLPPDWFGMDVSPFIALLLLWVLQKIVLVLVG
jgi:YggT family protein